MSNFSIVNLSNYNSPKIREVKNKDYVSYGDDNNYFEYLIDRYNGSPTNNAVINGISAMIYGKGLDATDSNTKTDDYTKMISLFKKDVTRKLVYDFYLAGQCAVQVIYSKDRKSIAQLEHIPIETIRAEKADDEGEIKGYYYFEDWKNISRSDEPLRIPAFGTSSESIELMYIKPYRAGYFYYSPVFYQGGLQYAELEEEIANYHLNNIKQGLAPSMLINFNNGTPSDEERSIIENRIYQKFSGSSNAGKFILAFNDNADTQATIEPIQLSDAHNQYQFLSDESSKKILVSHRIVSPMLFGIKDQTGLGNNAEELKTASILTDNTTIKPLQNILIDAFDQILAFNNISLNLYFKTLQPLEFTDLHNVVDKETREEETGVKLSADFPDDKMFELIDEVGEEEDLENWEIVDERPVDYDQEEALDKMIGLASTGSARPNSKSDQDGKNEEGIQFKVRYQYAPLTTKSNSRDFCKKMVAARKIYRKEDILAMGDRAVNAGWGLGGADTYSIWFYKGGGACHHFWMRKTYRAKEVDIKPDVGNPNAEVSVNQAKRDGFTPEVNDSLVAKRPVDMPNKGFVNK